MTVKQLKAKMNQAFDNHAAELAAGNTQQIQAAWNVYAIANSTYMEAYFGGDE